MEILLPSVVLRFPALYLQSESAPIQCLGDSLHISPVLALRYPEIIAPFMRLASSNIID